MIGLVAALIFVSSYCTRRHNQTENVGLSSDEAYLVEIYSRIGEARELHSANYLKSESLFVAVDSTIDTARISNTIRELNRDPDRWILVFRGIERAMGPRRGENPSEENR